MSKELGPMNHETRKAGLAVSIMQVADYDASAEDLVDLAHELRTTLAIMTLSSGNLELLYDRLSDQQRLNPLYILAGLSCLLHALKGTEHVPGGGTGGGNSANNTSKLFQKIIPRPRINF